MVPGRLNKRTRGFTVLELFMVTIIVAILAFVGWRSFKASKDIEREGAVRVNMRVAQIAAKSYFNDSGGAYPASHNDAAYLSYFPGGSCDQSGTKAGNFPINPFTNRPEPPLNGHVTDVNQARAEVPKLIGEPGQIFYSPITAPGSDKVTSFAIQGAGRDGSVLAGPQPGTTLVLSDH